MKNLALALTTLPFIASASSAVAFEKGDILVRGGFATVAPDESSSNINVGDDLGFGLTIDNNTQLSLTAAYFITDRVNVEVLAATPFTHDVNFAIDNPLGTGNQLGEVAHLPPTVTVNYYFNDPSSAFQPYVGAGLNHLPCGPTTAPCPLEVKATEPTSYVNHFANEVQAFDIFRHHGF